MKKITALFALFTLTLGLVFVACQKENLHTEKNTNAVTPDQQTELNDRAPGISIGITGKPYRGAKWSAKHGVEPCTQGFGLCDVEVSVDIDLAIIKSNGGNSYDIEFGPNSGAVAGAEFYGADEDPLPLPFSVASYFGNETMEMLPGNYTVEVDPARPFGYVTVNCNQTPLVSQSIWRPIGPLRFEHMAYIGCVSHFGFCSNPFPWPAEPLVNIGANEVAGNTAIIGENIVCDLDGTTLSPQFVNEILANPSFSVSNPYTFPQAMVEELANAAGVPVPANVTIQPGEYPVHVVGAPTPAGKIKIKISYNFIKQELTVTITF